VSRLVSAGFKRSLIIQQGSSAPCSCAKSLPDTVATTSFHVGVVEPMLFTLGVAGLWTLLKLGHEHHIDIVSFALTGYSSVLLWRNAVNRCNLAIAPNLSLMYHRNVR